MTESFTLYLLAFILIMMVLTALFGDMFHGKSEMEHTMELFDRCMIQYKQHKDEDHIALIVITGSPKVLGVNTDEIRWKFTLDGSLYAVEAK